MADATEAESSVLDRTRPILHEWKRGNGPRWRRSPRRARFRLERLFKAFRDVVACYRGAPNNDRDFDSCRNLMHRLEFAPDTAEKLDDAFRDLWKEGRWSGEPEPHWTTASTDIASAESATAPTVLTRGAARAISRLTKDLKDLIDPDVPFLTEISTYGTQDQILRSPELEAEVRAIFRALIDQNRNA